MRRGESKMPGERERATEWPGLDGRERARERACEIMVDEGERAGESGRGGVRVKHPSQMPSYRSKYSEDYGIEYLRRPLAPTHVPPIGTSCTDLRDHGEKHGRLLLRVTSA